MKLRLNSWFIAGSMIVLATGCQEPKEITPVAPPGFELTRTPATPQTEAQAIGEQGLNSQPATKPKPTPTNTTDSPPTPIGKAMAKPSGLVYETLKEGTGEPVKSGMEVKIHYTGTLTDGKVFDSSRERGYPLPTKIGVGKVIEGWDEGVVGMKVGERRKLTIPPQLAYKEAGFPPDIPGNATLIFDIELMEAN